MRPLGRLCHTDGPPGPLAGPSDVIPAPALGAPPLTACIVRAALSALAFVCTSRRRCGPRIPQPAARSMRRPAPPAAEAAPSTLYDVVVDLGRDGCAAAADRGDAARLGELEVAFSDRIGRPRPRGRAAGAGTRPRHAVAGADTSSWCDDADTRIRERVRALNEATDALGTSHAGPSKGSSSAWTARWRADRSGRSSRGSGRRRPEIQRRAELVGADLAAMRDVVRARRDQLLVAFDRATALQTRLDIVRASFAERRERIIADLRTLEDAPLWSLSGVSFPRDEMMAETRFARLELADYLRQYGIRLGILFAALTAGMFLALRQPSKSAPARDGAARRSAGIASASALLAGMLAVALLAPRGPFIFYRMIAFFLPILAGIVATRSFAVAIPATAWTLLFAMFVNEFRICADDGAGVGTSVLLAGRAAAVRRRRCVHDWRRRQRSRGSCRALVTAGPAAPPGRARRRPRPPSVALGRQRARPCGLRPHR